jgi:serine/threonine protein kinase/tetratricopeptide (TPR) repeat protein
MSLAAGTRLGRYRILDLIGTGGMGEVYRAEDPRLSREVAVKVLRSLDTVALKRFEREARAVASLAHPNTLAVYDVGEHKGLPYLVSELLSGQTLRKRLARPMPLSDTLPIVRQIADALIAVHEKGIVHRDLKPENVFILLNGTVKLLDFGVARPMTTATPAADPRGATPTTSTVMGTVAYMAPEQASGMDCDGRTDLWALGVMFYEMLAGRRPFGGETFMDTLAAVLTVDPEPLAAAVVPAPLTAIIQRTLAKEPADRFSSVKEFVVALDAFSAGADVAERPLHAAARPSVAVLPFVDLSPHRDHDYFCDGMAEEILNALARLPELRVTSSTRSFQFRGRNVDAQSAGAALGVQAVLEGSVRTTGDRLRVGARLVDAAGGDVLWSQQFDRDAADVFGVQNEIARMVVRAIEPTLSLPSKLLRPVTSRSEAYTIYLKGRFHWNKRTPRGLTDSIACFLEARSIDPQFARAAAGLADAYSMLGIHNLRAPDDVMPQAREAAVAALELDEALPDAHAALAVVRGVYEWERQQALDEYEQMRRLDPQFAAGLQSYAVHGLVPVARLEDALDVLRTALDVDPVSLPINFTLGFVLTLADRPEQAVDVLRRTLELEPHVMTHFFLGNALTELSDHARAIEHLQTALSLSGVRPDILAALGSALARSGNRDGARGVLTQLAELDSTRYVSPVGIARVHAALGESDAAFAALEHAARRRATDLTWLHVEPAFRPLANDPRFTALLARLRLGPNGVTT